MPIFLVQGVAEALQHDEGPVILIANLLTEGRGMAGFTRRGCRRRGSKRPFSGPSTSSSPT